MKKSLVMAMAMAMGVTASAYAANPFSDVPAGHWAYDAVAQLAAAGVVDGYGTTFGGEKLMTRYEMAQIVAKAMAKGGNCEKLAAEFAEELDALGVRVAKLEKKVDNVKITGNIRYSYRGFGGDDVKLKGAGAGYNRFRTRLFVNGAINDAWAYTGMLENDRYFDASNDNDTIKLKRAFLTGRLGGIKLRAGRESFAQSDMVDAEATGAELKYSFGKYNVTGWMLRDISKAYTTDTMADDARVYMAKVDTKFDKLGVAVQYWAADTDGTLGHFNIWEIGLNHPIGKDWTINGQYYKGSYDNSNYDWDKNGFEIGVKYAGAKAAKPGSWGAWATYSNRPAATYIKPSCQATWAYRPGKEAGYLWETSQDGYKGLEAGVNYTFAKNIVGAVRYFDYKGRSGDTSKVTTWWGDVTFTF